MTLDPAIADAWARLPDYLGQHVMLSVGLRVPVNDRTTRSHAAMVYLLWDWFDGGFFEMWK